MSRRATPDEVLSVEHLELFSEANVGLCILDDQLRYVALNRRLASIHGISAQSHLGKTLREILGQTAPTIEAAYKQVLASGEPFLNFQFQGELGTGMRRGIANLFPVSDANGRVTRVCAVVTLQDSQSLPEAPNAVLRSWKDIAQYVGTCVKTVQRWEHLYGFPVRRLKASKGSVVFALRHDVDAWMREKAQRPIEAQSAAMSSFGSNDSNIKASPL
jgi:transcriptional regulator with PAS, ATPase and Fis domain